MSTIAIPNGLSKKAVRVIVGRLLPLLSTDLVKAVLLAWVRTDLIIDKSNPVDVAFLADIQKHIKALLEARGHWIQDYFCSTHQTSASECGCLDEDRRTHHDLCGMKLMYDGGGYTCPACDAEVFELEYELEREAKSPV